MLTIWPCCRHTCKMPLSRSQTLRICPRNGGLQPWAIASTGWRPRVQETAEGYARRRAALRFERVLGAQVQSIDLKNKSTVLSLLAVTFEPSAPPEGFVTLLLCRRRRHPAARGVRRGRAEGFGADLAGRLQATASRWQPDLVCPRRRAFQLNLSQAWPCHFALPPQMPISTTRSPASWRASARSRPMSIKAVARHHQRRSPTR